MRNEVGDGANSRIDEASKVDRIREILFGSQMRDYDERFQRLEEHLTRETSEVRADTQKRLDALERFIKGEVDSINSRAAIEHGERCNATDKLGRDLAEPRGLWIPRLIILTDKPPKALANYASSC